MLQLIIRDRLFDQVREKEGKTYSPQGDLSQPHAFPEFGYMIISLETPQSEIAGVYASIDGIVADLAANEVSTDELDRVRKPRVELWRRNLVDNAFWVSILSGVWEDENVLTSVRTNMAEYAKVTPADIKTLAKTYLAPDKAWRLTVAPEPAVVSQAGAATGTRP